MRKSLVFLTSLLFALSAICADDGVNSISYGDELGSSELRIYFTPKVEDLVEISFSRNEVNDFFDEVIKIDGDSRNRKLCDERGGSLHLLEDQICSEYFRFDFYPLCIEGKFGGNRLVGLSS